MSVMIKCPNCKSQIGTIKPEFVLQKENADLRAKLAAAEAEEERWMKEAVDLRDNFAALKNVLHDTQQKLIAATDEVRDWKNAHALLKEQFHKQRVLLEAANKRLEEAEKQEPCSWEVYSEHPDMRGVVYSASYTEACHEHINDAINEHQFIEATDWKVRPVYTRPIPPADVQELQRDLSESEEVRELMAKILHDTAIALKGPSAELSRHSWHDLAEVAAKNALDAGTRIAELERKLDERRDYIDRKWSLAQDGFGVVRDDENGNYCYVDDALAVINKLLSEAREEGRKEDQEWLPIATAPKDGSRILVYRPLAEKTQDHAIDIKRGIPRNSGCWEETIPDGMNNENFTDGYCKPTHWMPLPAAPSPASLNAKEGGEC